MAQGPTHEWVQQALAAADKKAASVVRMKKLEGDAALLWTMRVKCQAMESIVLKLARETEKLRKQRAG